MAAMGLDRRRVLWGVLVAACAGSLAVSVGIARQQVIVGSVEGGWTYGFLQPASWAIVAVWLATASVAIAWLVVTDGRPWRWWPRLVAWFLLALLLQGALRALTPFTLEQMFVSEGANGFYSVARRYYPITVLSEFMTVRADWPLHAQSNMPGKLMLVYALKSVSHEPDVLAWLAIAVSNLGGLLIYRFTRDLLDDARAAEWSAVLYFLVPGKLYFFPLLNTVTPVAVLTCACLLLRWLRTGRAGYAMGLGVALYALVFYEPLPLVIGLLFAALMALAVSQGGLSGGLVARHATYSVAAFAITYVFIRLQFGFDLVSAFREIGSHATTFNHIAGRPYGVWVRQNLWDFAFGTGVAQSIVAIPTIVLGLVESRGRLFASPTALLGLSLLAVLGAVDLIGVNRGEVVRLWIFLSCFFQIPTAILCSRLESRAAMACVLLTTLLQAALGTAMIGFILPG